MSYQILINYRLKNHSYLTAIDVKKPILYEEFHRETGYIHFGQFEIFEISAVEI